MTMIFLAFTWLLKEITAQPYYEISLNQNPNMVLYMDNMAVGWVNKTTLAPKDKHYDAYMENKAIKIADKYLCKSLESTEATSCSTATAKTGIFDILFVNGLAMLKPDKSHVLAIGEYNMNTDMYDAIIVPIKSVPEEHYFLDIIKHDGGESVRMEGSTPL